MSDTMSERENQAHQAIARSNVKGSTLGQHTRETSKPFSRSALIGIDVASAIAASLIVAPIVTIIDLAVTEVAFGKTSLLRSARAAIPKLVCGPDRILLSRPFGSMFLLYAGTYITANTVDTVSSSADEVRAGASTSSLTKLGLVSTVNVGLSLAKDNQFAKAFGAASTRSMPLISYGPLMLRDAITLYASFNLPPLIADLLPVSWEGFMSRLAVAQLAAPAASQLVTTPLHLYGLDTANRRGKLSFRRRWDPIQKAWASTSAARALRVLPGLGLGNVVNTQVRTDLMARIHS